MATKWTVMVYMAAQDSHELDAHAVRDLREMERASLNESQVVVQINRPWPGRPHRYRVMDGQSCLVDGNVRETNMGSEETLRAFLEWALSYQADKYFLILWGHAYGLGFGRDHGDALKLDELRKALDWFRTARGTPVELLGANACAMSYAEAAFELQTFADYLVASQIAMPFAGWPYESILSQLGSCETGEQLGRVVAESYVRSFSSSPSDDQVAMTLLDLSKAEGLMEHITTLTKALKDVLDQQGVVNDRLTDIRTTFFSTVAGDVRPLIDLCDLSKEVIALCADLTTLEASGDEKPFATLATAAERVRRLVTPKTEQIGTAVLDDPNADGFVVFHKRHPELEGLNGLGIFAPFVTDDHDLRRLDLVDAATTNGSHRYSSPPERSPGRTEYQKLKLPSGSGWERLVYDGLRKELEHDVLTCIECTGAMTREEKAAVVQMLLGINSSFDRLDRTLIATRQSVLKRVRDNHSGTDTAQRSGGLTNRTWHSTIAEFGSLELFGDDEVPFESPKNVASRLQGASDSDPNARLQDEQTAARAREVAQALRLMEQAVARTERAAKRTLTHGTLGLGPGSGFREMKPGMGEVKPGMGEMKPGMGELKPGMGEMKPGMGTLAMMSENSPAVALTIVDLFVQVAQSLAELEAAARDFERSLAAAIAGPGADDVGFTQGLADRRIERRFRILSEASTSGRLTLRRVLSHPVCGFGPAPGSLDAEARRVLARTAGLTSTSLKLLWPPTPPAVD